MKKTKNDDLAVGFISLGCPKNTVDSERMLTEIAQANFLIAANPENCDILIINTCGFIEPAKQEAFDIIRQAIRWKSSKKIKKIIVSGCLVQRMGQGLPAEFPKIDAIVGLGQRDDITEIINEVLNEKSRPCYLAHHNNKISDDRVRLLTTSPHWAYLRISEGCDHTCSFCTIPSIRGRFRSKPKKFILEEARELADADVVELNLIAQDTTSYGRDLKIKDGASFFDLTNDQMSPEVSSIDRSMKSMSPGIICGNFCGKCVHKCPSKKLLEKELKNYDLSSRHSSLNRMDLL